MDQEVLGGGGDELSLVLEDLGPGLDGGDISRQSMARSNISLPVVNELLELLDGGDDVASLDVLDSLQDVLLERLGGSVASFELREVVISNHTVEEASGDLRERKELLS